MVYAPTAHNRTVYASPPVGGSGYEKPWSAYGLCAVFLRHIFAVAETAAQFLYRNRKNVIYSRERYAMLFAPPKYAPLPLLRGATKNLLRSRAAWTPPGSLLFHLLFSLFYLYHLYK
jgi:hypothetical protein